MVTACTPEAKTYTKVEGFTQGSTYHIIYNDLQGRDLRTNIEELLEDIDNSMSLYNPSSLLTRLNGNDTSAVPDRWIAECLEFETDQRGYGRCFRCDAEAADRGLSDRDGGYAAIAIAAGDRFDPGVHRV